MTKYGRPPSVVPPSNTLAMFGWSIRARACRSASNRATTCLRVHPRLDHLQGHPPADRARSARPRRPTPMPPSPICSSSLYGPMTACRRRPGSRAGRSAAAAWPAAGRSRKLPARKWSATRRSDLRARRAASPPQAAVEERGPRVGRSGRSRRPRQKMVSRASPGRASGAPPAAGPTGSHGQCGFPRPRTAHGDRRPVAVGSLGRQLRRRARPGRRPSAAWRWPGEMPRQAAASSTVSPAKYRSLTSSALAGSRRRQRGRGPRRGRAGRRPGRPRRGGGRRRGRPAGGRRRLGAGPCGGRLSTRMRRMASAAAAKKWPRPFQSTAAASAPDQPQVRLVDEGGGLERLPRLLRGQLGRRPASAARRTRAGAGRRRLRGPRRRPRRAGG